MKSGEGFLLFSLLFEEDGRWIRSHRRRMVGRWRKCNIQWFMKTPISSSTQFNVKSKWIMPAKTIFLQRTENLQAKTLLLVEYLISDFNE
jgi:hypothetical protein